MSIVSLASLPACALDIIVSKFWILSCKSLIFLFQSFNNLPVTQSNNAMSQSTAELGHNTSQAHYQSAQSIIVNR